MLVIEGVELGEVIPKYLNTVLEWKCAREIEGLALPRHCLSLLILVINVFVGAKRLIAILFDFLDGLLALVLALLLAKWVVLAIVRGLRLVLQPILLLNLPLLLAKLGFLESTLF